MVTVHTETGASLTVDDEVAEKFKVGRGGPPVSPDLFYMIGEEQRLVIEFRKNMSSEKREPVEMVLVNVASLP
jgi:hypothetical protein